ncbi:uncharacterized protein HKW66_Vig0137780 [Vigna angularis]|uniref:Uncharacterized protein n=1 Tax=Phaseolus angularis TaxID=3914 RepID=A0A8T0KEB1_PHAAN|nr:uncharacterized protein HKW66_Vig0137780 [Vigna angularis]
MAISVARGTKFNGVVDWIERTGSRASFVTLGEESGTDELTVAVFGREPGAGFARAFPATGNWAEVQIRKAAVLRPDAGIKDSDDDIRAIVGFGPEASLVAEAEELRGACGVELAATVFEDSEDGRVVAYGGYLLGREKGGEAVENGVVYVEDVSLLGELGGIPVVVSGKH